MNYGTSHAQLSREREKESGMNGMEQAVLDARFTVFVLQEIIYL
jgi:hypothetical protein